MSPRFSARNGCLLLVAIAVVAALLRLLTTRTMGDDGIVVWTLALPEARFLSFRLTAICIAALAGGCLGLSGLAFQVLLRNPLASPWVLGVSSGAGLGIMLGLFFASLSGAASMVGTVMVAGQGSVGAALGAVLAIVIVQWLGRRLGGFDPVSLVLAGIIVSATFAAGIMLLQHLVPYGLRDDLIGWMMGRISETMPPGMLVAAAILLGMCFIVGLKIVAALDAACLGEDEARSVGVDIDTLRIGLLVGGGALATIAVVLAGPIAFVGLIAPHVARRLMGAGHRGLVPGSVFAGVAIMLVAEAARQWMVFGSGLLPIGVLTSLVGGPSFLVLLLRREQRQ